jgi:thioredoxin-related protein
MLRIKEMRKLLVLLTLIIAAGCSNAQNIQTIAPYRILTTDSVIRTPKDLKKNKPVMLIYFSPDCSHCQHMMYEMKPVMKELRNIQVVMITFSNNYDLRGIREFYRDFGLANYPNFLVGTEGYSYVVQRYYSVRTTPYIAIYNHQGKLVKAFDKAPKMEELIEAVKKS